MGEKIKDAVIKFLLILLSVLGISLTLERRKNKNVERKLKHMELDNELNKEIKVLDNHDDSGLVDYHNDIIKRRGKK